MLCHFEQKHRHWECSRCGRIKTYLDILQPMECGMHSGAEPLSAKVERKGVVNQIVLLSPPCRHLGSEKGYSVKERCGAGARYLPVYGCALHRACSPFGRTVDEELIRPCMWCRDYEARDRQDIIG